MTDIRIGSRWVGNGRPVYIVAEAGSNHNGSLQKALRLIDVAVEAGADAVKFQNFKAARLYPRGAGQSDYLKTAKPIYEIIEELEMPEEWIPRLAAYCGEKGIEFMSTPFDEGAADFLAPYVNAFKVASYEMTHTPLVRHLARQGKPLIVSTGTATLQEVLRVVEVIAGEGNDQMILLQCTASYPTPTRAMNLRAMVTLRQATGRPVGLSDHSRDPILAPVLATALGACWIEKHVTLSNRLPGPDHPFAIEPNELAHMVRAVRLSEEMLGHGRKEVLPEEEELRTFARRTIFAVRDIRSGERLGPDNISVLRCGKLGFGLSPEQYESLLGRVAARDIAAETPVRLDDVGWNG